MKIKFLTLLIFIFLISCSLESEETSVEKYNINDSKEKLYINLDNNMRQKILAYITKLNIDDDWKDIKKEYESHFIEKNIVGKQDNISRGKIRKIYLKKLDKDLVNEKYDEYIYLVFDTDDKLIEKNIVKGKK